MTDPSIELVKNRAHDFCVEQQRRLDEGEITEAEWFDAYKRFFTANYLAAENPRAQAGHSGEATAYRYSRGMIIEAVHKSGSFLDVGCANGHLIEMLHRWLSGTEVDVTFYGLDISEGLLALARRRLPEWHDRFFLGNALFWEPPRQWDFVCVGELGYVPRDRERDLFEHLLNDYVAPGGRLILGPNTEERDTRAAERKLAAWGYTPTGYCEKSHGRHAALCRRMWWFDRERRGGRDPGVRGGAS